MTSIPQYLRRRARIAFERSCWLAILAMLTLVAPSAATADDMRATASQLSDGAFRLLDSINSGSGKAGPILAPVASLAGDAQTLSAALTANDRDAASRAMTSILSDRAQINSLTAGGSHGINLSEWDALKSQISELEKNIPAAKAVPLSATSRAGTASSIAPPSAERLPAAPKIQIASRVFKEGAVRVKGFLQGTDLKSAGIYDGEQKSRDIDVASTPGEQRINFDFAIQTPSPTQSIRITDVYGREAHAMVAPDASMVATTHGSEELIDVEPGASSARTNAGTTSGPVASSSTALRNNTAEIPRPSDELSPSRRRMAAGPSLGGLTDVQINVIDAEEMMDAPGNVEVIGQIAGRGVKRAGVYVNGRLVRSIPIGVGGFSGFDVTFPIPPSGDTKIRAYGNGTDFVEASIDTTANGAGGLNTYNDPSMYAPPGYPVYTGAPYGQPNPYANPYAYGTNPYAPNPYTNGYGPPPYYGARPGNGYPPQPAPKTPWWSKLLH